ncbi:hypothetical protein V8E36_003345 [Tilletia maclaganii]
MEANLVVPGAAATAATNEQPAGSGRRRIRRIREKTSGEMGGDDGVLPAVTGTGESGTASRPGGAHSEAEGESAFEGGGGVGRKTQTIYRTRVCRHSRNAVWDEKLLFHVCRYETNFQIKAAIYDWARISSHDFCGGASLNVAALDVKAPKPDPPTGLQPAELDLDQELANFDLPLETVPERQACGVATIASTVPLTPWLASVMWLTNVSGSHQASSMAIRSAIVVYGENVREVVEFDSPQLGTFVQAPSMAKGAEAQAIARATN